MLIELRASWVSWFWLFFGYNAVGVANTLFSLSLMWALAFVGAHYAVYTLIGYAAGFVTSYYMNARLNFKTRTSVSGLRLFVLVNGTLLLLVQTVQAVLIEGLAVPELYAVAFGVAVYTVGGFWLNHRVVYRPADAR